MQKKPLFILGIALFLIFILSGYGIQSRTMFGFHDITQAGRIVEFVENIKAGHIPPRIAPDFSFGMGYPMFTFYAPTAYWITSLLALVGLSVPLAVKLSFALATVIAGLGMYAFLRERYSDVASFVGAILLMTSPYVALEVFVRGNLSEMWFLALLPTTLWLVHKATNTKWSIVFAICFSLLLTSHNALSIVGALIVGTYSVYFPQRKSLVKYLVVGLALSAYFFVPAVIEISQTYATVVAAQTEYVKHFVCPRQLWSSPWGFGGSVEGCIDGMSFQLGKILILMGCAGIGIYIYNIATKKHEHKFHKVLMLLLVIGGLSLSLPLSAPVWIVFSPLLKLFQFPWRFLLFAVVGLAFFAAYAIERFIHVRYMRWVAAGIVAVAILMNMSFFRPNPDKLWSIEDFTQMYLSNDYIRNEIAFRVPEYVPISADYDSWLKLRENPSISTDPVIPVDGVFISVINQTPFDFDVVTQSRTFLVNKHYAPYWKIFINDKEIVPTDFDELGRPRFTVQSPRTSISVHYEQTPIEQLANLISICGLILLIIPSIQEIWTRRR